MPGHYLIDVEEFPAATRVIVGIVSPRGARLNFRIDFRFPTEATVFYAFFF